MEDIPQPAPNPYAKGDRVQVHIAVDDVDSEFHGRVCRVSHVFSDDLEEATGREMDSASYRLESVETGEILPVVFRHRDLIPADDDSEGEDTHN